MPEITTGQVWRLKQGKFGSEKVLISAVNIEERKIWVAGVVDEVDPIWKTQYLRENYELMAGWQI